MSEQRNIDYVSRATIYQHMSLSSLANVLNEIDRQADMLLNKIDERDAEIARLTAENERLRESLELYADRTNWAGDKRWIQGNGSAMARLTLRGAGEGEGEK